MKKKLICYQYHIFYRDISIVVHSAQLYASFLPVFVINHEHTHLLKSKHYYTHTHRMTFTMITPPEDSSTQLKPHSEHQLRISHSIACQELQKKPLKLHDLLIITEAKWPQQTQICLHHYSHHKIRKEVHTRRPTTRCKLRSYMS